MSYDTHEVQSISSTIGQALSNINLWEGDIIVWQNNALLNIKRALWNAKSNRWYVEGLITAGHIIEVSTPLSGSTPCVCFISKKLVKQREQESLPVMQVEEL